MFTSEQILVIRETMRPELDRIVTSILGGIPG